MKFLAILFVLAGLACIGVGSVQVYQGLASKGWKPVPAKIVESRVDTSRRNNKRRYHVDVVYEYQVDGKTHRSERLSFSRHGSGNRFDAEEVQAQYVKGSTVTAYCKPGQPEEAVLQPGTSFTACLVPLLGVVFTGVSIWLFRPGPPKAETNSGNQISSPS